MTTFTFYYFTAITSVCIYSVCNALIAATYFSCNNPDYFAFRYDIRYEFQIKSACLKEWQGSKGLEAAADNAQKHRQEDQQRNLEDGHPDQVSADTHSSSIKQRPLALK